MPNLEKAIQIAATAHNGQTDKGGKPYILHPLRVMIQMDSEAAMIVAVLHDVVEDSEYTFDNLKAFGFSNEIITAVKYLTKQEGEPYETYLQRIKSNSLARQVKLADLKDNMNLQRLQNITSKDVERQEKYAKAVQILAS